MPKQPLPPPTPDELRQQVADFNEVFPPTYWLVMCYYNQVPIGLYATEAEANKVAAKNTFFGVDPLVLGQLADWITA